MGVVETKSKPKAKQKQKPAVNKKPAPKKANQKQPVKTKAKPKTKQPAKIKPGTKTAYSKPRKNLENSGDSVLSIPNIEIDFCGVKLTPLRYSFLLYYLIPGQPCFHNAYQSALKAGYAESTARVDSYGILREPDIQKIINANDKLAQTALHEAALRAIEIKNNGLFTIRQITLKIKKLR